MAFLELTDGSTTITVRVRSNEADQKYNPHRQDMARMFDGTMRLTRQGIYRQWDLTTAALIPADYLALIAMLNGPTLPLTATGDLTDGVAVRVIPQSVNAPPLHANTADLRRRVTFTLHETGSVPLVDDSAVPLLFWRRGFGYFTDDAMTTEADDQDYIAVWEDQSGNNYHGRMSAGAIAGDNSNQRPFLDVDAVRFGVRPGPTANTTSLRITQPDGSSPFFADWTDFATLTAIEMMISLRATIDPPANSGERLLKNEVLELGGSLLFYPDTDGAIKHAIATTGTVAYDSGDPSEDLTAWNVWSELSDDVAGYESRLNNVVRFFKSAADRADDGEDTNFAGGSKFIGGLFPNVGSGFFGWVRDVVMFDGTLTAPQRDSWYAYMSGATDSPPL